MCFWVRNYFSVIETSLIHWHAWQGQFYLFFPLFLFSIILSLVPITSATPFVNKGGKYQKKHLGEALDNLLWIFSIGRSLIFEEQHWHILRRPISLWKLFECKISNDSEDGKLKQQGKLENAIKRIRYQIAR